MSDSDSQLASGTRCVIVAGCPENIGLLVQVVRRIGKARGYTDGYEIRTLSSRNFHQFWQGRKLELGTSSFAFTERRKMRPLVNPRSKDVADGYPHMGEAEAELIRQTKALMIQEIVSYFQAGNNQ